MGVIEDGKACSNLVFPGAKLRLVPAQQFINLNIANATKSSAIYCVDNLTKKSVLCDLNNVWYTNNAFFGWSETKLEDIRKCNVSDSKIELARAHKGREIFLYDVGSKKDTDFSELLSSNASLWQLPLDYHQSTYGKDSNGCVWLSVCQLLFDVHQKQAKNFLNMYIKNPTDYEYLRFFRGKMI